MSGSTGSLIGGAIGAVIGFYYGGPQGASYGWAIGATIGGVVDPQRIDGPRLQDRKVQVSSYGVAIPILYGGDAGAGNVIWSTDLEEFDVDGGGKGGPDVTNHTYSVSCAILISEGVVQGIRRIWADAKLVYDVSDTADSATQAASSKFSNYFVFYKGTEDQMPDPTMEAVLGAGNVTAYRGYCYIVFTDLPLADYGNRIPNFRFESSEAPDTSTSGDAIVYAPLTVGAWSGGDKPHSVPGETEYRDMTLTHVWTDYVSAAAGNAALFTGSTGEFSTKFIAYETSTNSLPNLFSGGATLDDDPQYVYYCMAAAAPDQVLNIGSVTLPFPDSATFCGPARVSGGTPDDGVLYWSLDAPHIGDIENVVYKISSTLITGSGEPYTSFNNCTNFPGPSSYALGNHVEGIRVERLPSPPADDPGCLPGDPCVLGLAQVPQDPDWCISCDGVYSQRVATTYEVVTGTFHQLVPIEYGDGILKQNGLGPVLDPSDPNYDDADFWAAATSAALANGTLNPLYAGDAPFTVTSVAKGTRGVITTIVAEEANTTLDAIVADVWARCGGLDTEIDVTALEGIAVQGFSIARQMQGQAAMLPLQQAFWWDFVESGRKIKAVLRGADAVVTMSLDALGATESTDQQPAVVPNRAQEAELPATLNVNYPVRATGYETGTQRARRLVTASNLTVTMEVAVVMPDQRAAEMANVNLYTAWTSRTQRAWSTTRAFAAYEPTDNVVLNDGEFTALVRITERNEDGGVINWKGQDERPAGYSPQVTPGVAQGNGIGTVRYDGPMKLELIDSPIVLETNNDPGLYGAGAGYASTWPGGSAWKSTDGGTTYTQQADMPAKATIGYAQSVLGDFAGGNMVDEINTVDISMHSGALASITNADLLNNGNAAILGGEIIQFRTASVVSDGVFRLSGLLRGRRGTEQFMATHAVGDRLVVFNVNVYRLPGVLSEIGAERKWKGVTTGQSIDSGIEQTFTNTGAGLKPLAPVHVYAIPQPSGRRRVKWVRRTRIGWDWRDGVDAPLGETTESYSADLIDATGAVVATTTTADPEWLITGAFAQQYQLGDTQCDLQMVGYKLAGMREPSVPVKGAVSTFFPGTGVLQAAEFIGEETMQLANDGTALFVATINGASFSHIFRIDPATMTTTHTHIASLAAGCRGVVYDGSHIWATDSGDLLKLSPTDLSVVADYPGLAGARLCYDGTSIFVAGNPGVLQVDPSTGAVVRTIATGAISTFDAVASGGYLFVQADDIVKSFRVADGALIDSVALSTFSNTRKQFLAVFDGMAVAADAGTHELLQFDLATGVFKKRVFVDGLEGIAGGDGTRLFLRIGSRTYAFTDSDFAGFSVAVYQISSTVGRGFPAVIEL